jgi:predicted nucleotidyltransferase
MLCVKPDQPVDPIILAILREVDRLTRELGLAYFVAGATARDILLTNVYELNTGRATRDIDFAVAVENWQQFEAIKARLTADGKFSASKNTIQRLYYRISDNTQGYPLDIIPFGGVEQPPNIVAWPPDMKVLINVAGYEETIDSATLVQVADGLVVRVASLPGLVLLKLFAWLDRGDQDSKDAQDLLTLFRLYADAGNLDRLYGDETGLMEAVGYDPDLAGPRLLGRDVRTIAAPQTLEQILSLFGNPTKADRLIAQMTKVLRGVEDPITVTERLVDQFKVGLMGQG